MLNEYTYHNDTGTLLHFMDDETRAMELFKKGIKVLVRAADPFRIIKYQPFVPYHLKETNGGYWGRNCKYSYLKFKRVHQMKESGATLNNIGAALRISRSAIVAMLYNKGENRFIKEYQRRLKNDS